MNRSRTGLFVLLLSACSSAQRSTPHEQPALVAEERTKLGFPTARALDRLKEIPLPDSSKRFNYHVVGEWQLAGPFPERYQPAVYQGQSELDQWLANKVAQKAGLLIASEAMHCAARELGRFFLEHESHPHPDLQRFILGRCRTSPSNVAIFTILGGTPKNASDSDVMDRWQEQVRASLDQIPPGARSVGLWFGRAEEKAVVLVVSGVRKSLITEVITSTSGWTVNGELLTQAASVRAMVNRGAFGFAECAADPMTKLPRFSVFCVPDPRDAHSWIDLAAFPAGRLLGETGASLLIFPQVARERSEAESAERPFPSSGSENTFRQVPFAKEVEATNLESLSGGLLSVINEVRHEAKLEPLVYSAQQSRIATEAAPYYFAASAKEIPTTIADQIVLGLRAGWSVDGVVRRGLFSSMVSMDSHQVGPMVSAALDRPFTREVLLDPEARQVAIGPVFVETPAVTAAVVATYALFEDELKDELVRQVFEKVKKARAAAGRTAPRLQPAMAEISKTITAKLEEGELPPKKALNEMVTRGMEKMKRSTSGFVVELSQLDQLEISERILSQPILNLAIVVSYRKPKDEPWGRYVVLITFEVNETA